MQVGLPKYVPYYGKIHRIIIYIENFIVTQDESGGLPSGTTINLIFKIYKNNSLVKIITVSYESGKHSDYVYDTYDNIMIKPGDIIKVELAENFESGYNVSWSGVKIDLYCSKLNI